MNKWSKFWFGATVAAFIGGYVYMSNQRGVSTQDRVLTGFWMSVLPFGLAVIPLVWQFFLGRVSEVSKAVKGK